MNKNKCTHKHSIATKLTTTGIRLYKKLITPYIIRSCRYEPSCSEYAQEALKKHGFLRGAVLSAWRILRCNPFSHGGFDPVK